VYVCAATSPSILTTVQNIGPSPEDPEGTLDSTLDRTAVQAVLSYGEAVALLPEDPWSPIRYRHRWYGMRDNLACPWWRASLTR